MSQPDVLKIWTQPVIRWIPGWLNQIFHTWVSLSVPGWYQGTRYQVPVPGTVAIVVQTWWLMSKIYFYYVPVPCTALVLPVLRSNLLNVIWQPAIQVVCRYRYLYPGTKQVSVAGTTRYRVDWYQVRGFTIILVHSTWYLTLVAVQQLRSLVIFYGDHYSIVETCTFKSRRMNFLSNYHQHSIESLFYMVKWYTVR